MEERAAAEAGALGLDQRKHRLHCDRRVDRAAAAFEDVEPRLRRQRVRGDHERLGGDGNRRGLTGRRGGEGNQAEAGQRGGKLEQQAHGAGLADRPRGVHAGFAQEWHARSFALRHRPHGE
jgi:hypothetical protein